VAERRGLTIQQVLPVSAKPKEEPEPAAAAPAPPEETDGEAEDHADA
jgi:hypothetical protein